MILVTGATGFIGSRLVQRLAGLGHDVRAMAVEDDPLLDSLDPSSCEIVTADITRPETLRDCCCGIDTLFHLAAVLVSNDQEAYERINYQGTKNVVEAAIQAGVRHFVFLSAAAAGYRTPTDYGKSKRKSEALMTKRGKTRFTIVRPTLLYGAKGSQELKMYVERLRAFPLIAPVLGMGKARKRPVWLEDVVEGLAKLVGSEASYGKIYDFTGGTDVSMWQYTRLICDTFGIRKPMVPVPGWLCRLVISACERSGMTPPTDRNALLGVTMDANASPKDAERDIGYRPISLHEGYAKAFASQEDLF